VLNKFLPPSDCDETKAIIKAECQEIGTPSPFAVQCWHGGRPTKVYLTRAEYGRQLSRPDSMWTCPACGKDAFWDDANYEVHQDEAESNSP